MLGLRNSFRNLVSLTFSSITASSSSTYTPYQTTINELHPFSTNQLYHLLQTISNRFNRII
ncbi:hypothetical protein CW304_25065 [Bacillus sp. UFRGS-B20]|nr:hypothetical protein CW304_25065 [Bacillus sp. UFRGS-B20]